MSCNISPTESQVNQEFTPLIEALEAMPDKHKMQSLIAQIKSYGFVMVRNDELERESASKTAEVNFYKQKLSSVALFTQEEKSDYRPHALHPLIAAALSERPLTMAQLYGALSNESFLSRGNRIKVASRTLRKEVEICRDAGYLIVTGSGYALANDEAGEILSEVEFGD